jgi:hypothetical protein
MNLLKIEKNDYSINDNSSLKSDVRAHIRRHSGMSIDLEFLQKDNDSLISKVQLMLLGNYHTQGSK